CIIGSPPEIVITEVRNSASLSMRSSITSIGTGSLVLSYSLQYVQDRLHRRIGTICTNTGCFVEAKARIVCRTPRVNLLKLLAFGISKNYIKKAPTESFAAEALQKETTYLKLLSSLLISDTRG